MSKYSKIIFGGLILTFLFLNTLSLRNISKQANKMETLQNEVALLRNQVSNIRFQATAPIENRANQDTKEILGVADLAKYLKIDITEMYKIIEDKDSKIPYIMVQGDYRFSKPAIDEWMKSRFVAK